MEIKIDLKGLPDDTCIGDIKEIENQIVELAKIKVSGKKNNKRGTFSYSDSNPSADDLIKELEGGKKE